MLKEIKKVPFSEWVTTFGKDYKGMISKASITPRYERVPSRAIAMTYALYGGVPHGGRLFEFSGPNSSGKTTAAFAVISDYLRTYKNSNVLFVDVEQSLDVEYQCKMNFVDQERVYVCKPRVGMAGEQILGMVLDMAMQIDNLALIVFDSIPALIPAIDLEEDFEKDNGMRGTLAKYLYKWLRECLPVFAENKIDLLLLNQTRVKGKTHTGFDIVDEPCGDATKYYSSIRVRFGKKVFVDENGDELEMHKGSATEKATNPSTGEGASGIRLNFAITKNKTAPVSRGGGYITYLYDTGMYYLKDLFEVAIKLKFIEQVNASRYQLLDIESKQPLSDGNGKPIYGLKKELFKYFKENEDFALDYLDKLSKVLTESTETLGELLDETIAEEIAKEEKALNPESSSTKKSTTENVIGGE